jgi:glycosyltransferase involved in cell wall biosynthesis
MYLVIDGQALQTPDSRGRGIGRYARNLVAAITAARPHWRIEVVQNDALPAIDAAEDGSRSLVHFQPPFPPDRAHREQNEQSYADWLNARRPDAILVLSCFERHALVPAFSGPRPKIHAVAYDLIPLVFHDRYLSNPLSRAEYEYRLRQFMCFDGLWAISDATVADVQLMLEEDCPKIINIGGAPDPAFTAAALQGIGAGADSIRRRHGLKDDFFLFVGGCDFRKNMPGAIAAFAALPADVCARTDFAIVCAMNAEEKRALRQHADGLGCGAAIKFLGFVSDEELRQLYHACRLSLFPSLYEGLGLPVLEALQCGAPVVTSDRSALPEYAGPHSWLADPECPRAMAETLQRALAEPREARRAERISFAQGFTWSKTAERACAFLEESVGRVRRRRRIAWVSPLPPARSGIADYSAELLAVLGDSFEIELVVDDAAPPVTPKLATAHAIIAASELKTRHAARPFDLFVYHVGNSDFHVYMLDLMRQFPGVVVLHDFHLGGLIMMAARAGKWPGGLPQALRSEGEDQLAEWLESDKIADFVAKEYSPLNSHVLHGATAVVVHSRYSWQRVRRLVSVPVALLPQHGYTPPRLGTRREERDRLGLDEDAFVVCTLGIVGFPKRIPSLVRSVTSLPERIRNHAHLFIVGGEVAPRLKQELDAELEQAGLAGHLHFVGHVDLRDLWAYARASDVCVQLRYPSRGESSAAVLRILRVGTACLVSDQGAMAEFPPDVVWTIRSPHHEVHDVAAALERLHDHPHEKDALGRAGLRFIQGERDLHTIADQYAALLDLTMASAARPAPSSSRAA